MRFVIPTLLGVMLTAPTLRADDAFRTHVAPIFEQHCVRCHQGEEPKGGLSLTFSERLSNGGDSGPVVVPGKPDESYLLDLISGDKPEMPRNADPLTAEQVAHVRRWIADGAAWPAGLVLKERRGPWWSLEPLKRPAIPAIGEGDRGWVRTPVDAFVLAKLREQGLSPSAEADRRTLIRRLFFDLIGLPPSPEEIDAFVDDPDLLAYEKLVERLLASPHYGERWARHWLDVVHYGDTHGFDKDKLRPNAWPYRDYVIRAFNDDKPYARFVKEQLAGDRFFPDTVDGIVALGFIAAGPFDWVGQIEVADGTLEKQRVRNLDRDDMVSVTMNTFTSLTAQCARCHAHKFDPISQEDYYSLQAVFAGVDRADRPYDVDPQVARGRVELQREQQRTAKRKHALQQRVAKLGGPELAELDKQIAGLSKEKSSGERPEFGYHSRIEPRADVAKWVQVDLGETMPIESIVYVGCHDDFAGIGAGFGFPLRYKIEISNDPEFKEGVEDVVDHTAADVPNPGVEPQKVALENKSARFVRVTATKLVERKNDYIFALAELSVLTHGTNAALGKPVTSLDSIEAPVRWQRRNLVDGYYYGIGKPTHVEELAQLKERRTQLLQRVVDQETLAELRHIEETEKQVAAALKALPAPQMVFAAATTFAPSGKFQPTQGTPRPIHLLHRGSEKAPGALMQAGTVSAVPWLPSRFELAAEHTEAERRAALAEWIVDARNPLTWRSIVNRVWQYHFGRGIVETPNDFGRMGAKPTHPELLDWLAVEFRDGGQSIKHLHRLIVNSATYRQSSSHNEQSSRIDAGNRYLWRMNRRRLEAEAVRDAVLAVSGKLDSRMSGPGFKPFGFKDDHSPHYKYHEHDPDDPAAHRRSVYRFIVRSVPDPFMTTLDCADPSQSVPRRNETLTALQALALLNNKFVVRLAEHFAARVDSTEGDPKAQIRLTVRLALGREPTMEELETLVPIASQHRMANVCRLLFNMNEFVFVD